MSARTLPSTGRTDAPVARHALATLRVDQIGSLVPPDELQRAFHEHAEGTMPDDELRAVQDQMVERVIARQDDIGLPIVTDGEFRRRNFQESFSAAVDGFDVPENVARLTDWREANSPLTRTEQKFEAAGPAILTRRPAVNRLSFNRNPLLEEYAFARRFTDSPLKVTLIGPDRVSQRFAWERSRSVYADMDAFIADVVAIQRRMIRELVDAGCRYVHIDAPGLTAYVDGVSLQRMRDRGENPAANLERAIKAENDLIAGFDDVVFGLHICRGNSRGIDPATGKIMPQWHREGAYDGIAEQLFGTLNHDRLLLEYNSARAGGFAPLRYIRKGAIAVLGLVTTKSEEVETADDLCRQVEAASQFIPVEQLAISPQCGFSSDIGLLKISENAQWRKFEVLLKAARKIWSVPAAP